VFGKKKSFGFWLHCLIGHTMEGAESVVYACLLFRRNEHARVDFGLLSSVESRLLNTASITTFAP
jgi:hypothetical protein